MTHYCSAIIPERGLKRTLSGMTPMKGCTGKPVVALKGKALCSRHGLKLVEQYLAAKGDPANVTWL